MDIPIVVSGDSTFALGMDGFTSPGNLAPGEYVAGMNLINRGGIAQTRPGSVAVLGLPDGNLQGMTTFTPVGGTTNIVACVDGVVYAAPYPFLVYAPIPGIQFSPNSRFIAWAKCLKSTDYTPEGVLYYLDLPKSVLMMQDGATRAAYWDGTSSGHLNPTPSNQETTLPGFDETPVGLWMIWSNNRLWVSRGSQIFASDIGNPMKFTESQYLNEGRAFYLTGDCTGMSEVSNGASGSATTGFPGFIAFTNENGMFFQSSISDRTQWLATPGFQQLIMPNIGCIAPRSIVHQYGLIWWWTAKGLINQNAALSANISSKLDVQDNEMLQSKFNLSYDLTGIAGGFADNFLFHAVPNGERLNSRLHVLDQAPFEANANSWPSYWTGWRPVEFSRCIINSQERVFCASVDYDGVNRVWELFRPEKTDSGVPITSFLVTRQHFWDNRDYKRFRYAEIEMQGIEGPTAVMVAAAGMRGAFQKIMDKDVVATVGQVYADQNYSAETHWFAGSTRQSRILLTTDGSNPSDCNSERIESDERGLIDKQLCLLIVWSGIAGVSAYRIFAQGEPRAYSGVCEDNETGETRLLTPDGCGSTEIFSTSTPFERYCATVTFTKLDSDGDPVTSTVTQCSIISQVDAERKAQKIAEWYVLTQIGEILYGGEQVCEAPVLEDSGGDEITDYEDNPIETTSNCP